MEQNPLRFASSLEVLKTKGNLCVENHSKKVLKWFAITNAAVVLSLVITTGGIASGFVPFILICGTLFPFISLAMSKSLAIKAYDIQLVGSETTDEHYDLVQLVQAISEKAGLTTVPAIGVYYSDDMNAFATGASKDDSLVAFSSGLLSNMTDEEIAAVAAHEIAHIANGDMITMSICQSVINSIVLLISIPLRIFSFMAANSKQEHAHGQSVMINVFRAIAVAILLFLGNLVTKFYSRKREHEADLMASRLVGKDSMIKALERLSVGVPNVVEHPEDAKYAMMKINSKFSSIGEWFSSHPTIEKRISKINETPES